MLPILKGRISIFSWSLVAAISWVSCFTLLNNWETRKLSTETENSLFLQGYAFAETSSNASLRKTFRRERSAVAEYRFKNFNNDPIHIEISVPVDQLEEYSKGYGYTQAELDSLKEWQNRAFKDAYQNAIDHSLAKADIDRIRAEIKDKYQQKVHELLNSRGFTYQKNGVLIPDIPGIAKRNVNYLSPVALDINKVAEAKNYDALTVVGATLSLMQTGLEYERVPLKKQERIIGGIYPPLVAMMEGRGDCDTKTALMASILLNWDRAKLIGVGMPNHYLIGVLRTPNKGDAFVEYGGLSYVLMEPAGPGLLAPGMVSEYTLQLLNAGDHITLEPLKKN